VAMAATAALVALAALVLAALAVACRLNPVSRSLVAVQVWVAQEASAWLAPLDQQVPSVMQELWVAACPSR